MIDLIEWNNGHFCYRLHPNGEVERGGMGGSGGSIKVWGGVYVDTQEALDTAAAFFDAAGYARGCAEKQARIEELERELADQREIAVGVHALRSSSQGYGEAIPQPCVACGGEYPEWSLLCARVSCPSCRVKTERARCLAAVDAESCEVKLIGCDEVNRLDIAVAAIRNTKASIRARIEEGANG